MSKYICAKAQFSKHRRIVKGRLKGRFRFTDILRDDAGELPGTTYYLPISLETDDRFVETYGTFLELQQDAGPKESGFFDGYDSAGGFFDGTFFDAT